MSITIKGQIRQTGRTATKDLAEAPPPPPFTNTLQWTVSSPVASSDNLGYSAAISGNLAIVGAIGNDTGASKSGRAYIIDTTTGNIIHTLNNPTPAIDDQFGESIAISGNIALVGAPRDNTGASNAGSVYVYDVVTGNLLQTINNPTPAVDEYFGGYVGISGNRIVASSGASEAYIYDTSGNLLHTVTDPSGTFGNGFGARVAIDGSTVLIGHNGADVAGTNDGIAYVYDTSGNLLHTLNNPTPESGDQFGSAVSVNGNLAVIGAYGENSLGGRAYIFDVTTGNLLHTLNDPTPTADDRFGFSVAISGDLAVVGANREIVSGQAFGGRAYVYNATTGVLEHTLSNPTPANGDVFGWAVDIDVNQVIIGAFQDNTTAANAGSVYIYN